MNGRRRRVRHQGQPERPVAPSDVFPSEDEIGAMAHELFIRGGRHIARIPECWLAAEDELLKRAASRLIGRRADPPR